MQCNVIDDSGVFSARKNYYTDGAFIETPFFYLDEILESYGSAMKVLE